MFLEKCVSCQFEWVYKNLRLKLGNDVFQYVVVRQIQNTAIVINSSLRTDLAETVSKHVTGKDPFLKIDVVLLIDILLVK